MSQVAPAPDMRALLEAKLGLHRLKVSDEVGIELVQKCIRSWCWPVPAQHEIAYVSKDARGASFAKRYAAWVKRETRTPVPNAALAAIGQQASLHLTGRSEVIVDLIEPPFTWGQRAFGKTSTSCWWYRRRSVPDTSYLSHFERAKGFCLRLYEDSGRRRQGKPLISDGRGRLWLYPFGPAIYAFNPYSEHPLVTPAMLPRLAAQLLGLEMQRVLYGYTVPSVHINNGRMYELILTGDSVPSLTSPIYGPLAIPLTPLA